MILGYQNNFNLDYQFYFKCDQYSCLNPLQDPNSFQYNSVTNKDNSDYCTAEWCKEEYLPRGEYGKKRPWIFNNFDLIAYILLISGFLLNHFVHNKGKKPGLKLNLPDKWLKKAKQIMKDANDSEEED